MSVSRRPVALGFSVSRSNVVRKSLFGCAFSILFALACTRGERDGSPSPAPGVRPANTPPVNPFVPSGPLADGASPGAAQPKAEPATSTACTTDSDCRTFSDACGICSCRPFAKTSPDPKCPGPRMSCLIDPCTGQGVFCRKGNCALGAPGDAAGGHTSAPASKDAGAVDAVAKGAGSTAPATSAAPKARDAARE
jgi:hypothetical protein